MKNTLFRYPGVKPFETSESGQYFGRQRDIQDLHDLILLEKLTVLFGKSGYGKSSLLNAGIIPRLQSGKGANDGNFTPILIKFSSYTAGSRNTPVKTVIDRLRMSFEPAKKQGFTAAGNTLWTEFKKCQKATGRRKYLLLFDQFEEYFTYPKEEQVALCEQLAELVYTEIPQSLRDHWDNLSDEDKSFISEELDVHVVFSIREDRLSWLSSMQDYLPAILHKRYELKGLTDEQAREAILLPAGLPQSLGFQSHQYEYTESALKILLTELKKGGAEKNAANRQEGRIEAFLLQICCENIERRLIERAKQGDIDVSVDPEDLPRFDRIYEEYYHHKIAELPESQQEVAKRLIEDELVTLNEATGVIFRLNADGRKLTATPGVTDELLKKLTDSFLLRAEPNTTGGFNYEISHDTLVAPVLKAKAIRLEAEKRKNEEQAKAAREKELIRERQRRRNATVFAVVGVLLALFASIASVYAFRLRNDAVEATQKAQRAEVEAVKAKETAEQRLKELQREKALKLMQDGEGFFRNDEYRSAISCYKRALELIPGDPEVLRRIRECEGKLKIN